MANVDVSPATLVGGKTSAATCRSRHNTYPLLPFMLRQELGRRIFAQRVWEHIWIMQNRETAIRCIPTRGEEVTAH